MVQGSRSMLVSLYKYAVLLLVLLLLLLLLLQVPRRWVTSSTPP